MAKILYIIAGPNGAGKTTASYNLLPDLWNCREFVNADEIARECIEDIKTFERLKELYGK